MLTFARVERGSIEYRFGSVSMDEVRATAESLVLPQATSRGLTLAFKGCDAGYARAPTARSSIRWCSIFSATRSSSRAAVARVAAVRTPRRMVAIVVEDSGRGIPADRLAEIFEPFVQLDSKLTRAQDGVGLGLAISRDLARGMGGDLTAQSQVGVGSQFTLTLESA